MRAMRPPDPDVQLAVAEPSLLGESPFWHPQEQVLYWCDIPGCRLSRYDPRRGDLSHWAFDTDLACCAPMQDGGLLLALRDGIWRLAPSTGRRELLAKPPYDVAQERYNDGKCDPQGRFWAGTIHEGKQPVAALYRYSGGEIERMAGGITTSNGLAWSPNGRTMYWCDTPAHTVWALSFDPLTGDIGDRREFTRFADTRAEHGATDYGGRPDGAAVDVEGCYWVAMYEGQRVLRISPDGEILRELVLPVSCPTMPCFGGPDLKTLYITTAREKRPAAELAAQPWAGCVLSLAVDVPGLPVNYCA